MVLVFSSHRPYRFRIVFEATDGARREVRRCWEVKLRLLSRDALDGRTLVRYQFDVVARGIVADPGEDKISM